MIKSTRNRTDQIRNRPFINDDDQPEKSDVLMSRGQVPSPIFPSGGSLCELARASKVTHEWRILDCHLAHHCAEVAHPAQVSAGISVNQSKLNSDQSEAYLAK